MARKNRLQISKQRVYPLAEIRESTIRVFRCMVTDPIELIKMKWLGMLGFYRIQSLFMKPTDHVRIAMRSNPEPLPITNTLPPKTLGT